MKIKLPIVCISIFLWATYVNADDYESSGTIKEFIVSSTDYNGDDSSFGLLRITGFTTAGLCYASSDGVALLVEKTEQGKVQASMILAAALSGAKVYVRTNDKIKDAYDRCTLAQIRIGSNI